jgi:hypothetical protein
MPRFDLYSHVHKAVRSLLFEAVEAVGRTDFTQSAEIPAAAAAVRHTIRLTGLHARHEDREIHPILHELAPEVAADLEAAHDRFDGLEREIERCFERLESATLEERVSLGRRLHEMLGALVADQLQHMAAEESRANRILWAHRTDAELLLVQQRIVSAIEPEELAEWAEAMLASGNRSERVALLAGLSALPAPVFARVTAPARTRIGEAVWTDAFSAAQALVRRSA